MSYFSKPSRFEKIFVSGLSALPTMKEVEQKKAKETPSDLTPPRRTRYQTALHPDLGRITRTAAV